LPVEIIQIAGDAMARNAKLLAEYFDEDELAEEVDHSVRTLRGWRREGKGPPFVRIGRRALYRKNGVLEWLRSKEKEAVAAA
jgi:predicted site-specific integrase-resolvase